jgi:hypothetical protein
MASNAQTIANQQNSKKSSGPKSRSGKDHSRMNALKHAFASRCALVLEQEVPFFKELFEKFLAEYDPKTETERFLVHSLAEISFSVSRIRAHENNIMLMWGFPTNDFRREAGRHSDYVSYTLNQAESITDNVKVLNTLSIYEQRKMRAFRETLKDLQALQSARKAQEQEELAKAAAVRKVMKATNQSWQPAEDGFVCSIEKIDDFLRRQERSDHHSAHSKAA